MNKVYSIATHASFLLIFFYGFVRIAGFAINHILGMF